MRLADFILAHTQDILAEWDVFAAQIWPESGATQAALRDHAEEILLAAARDMQSSQTELQQSDKSQGQGDEGHTSATLDSASITHARGRVGSGFSVTALVSEYRALRATVIRLWSKSGHHPDTRDLVDLTRFNETIDQSLAEALRGYTLQVDRARQMFLAILGHDLRNPLNAILISTDLLKDEPKLSPDAAEATAQIARSSQAMAHMLTDFLDFAQTQLGKRMPIVPSFCDLGSLCTEVVAEARAAHPNRGIRFTQQGDTSGEWDPVRLRQLLSNLLGNAIQHGAVSTPIELAVDGTGDHVKLAMTNEGPPIPPEILPRIFDPMVRGLSPESRAAQRVGSMGLGLYIAREVVTAHGGEIDVESTPAGRTAFTARLPRRGQKNVG